MPTYSTKEVVENMLNDMREALAQGKFFSLTVLKI